MGWFGQIQKALVVISIVVPMFLKATADGKLTLDELVELIKAMASALDIPLDFDIDLGEGRKERVSSR